MLDSQELLVLQGLRIVRTCTLIFAHNGPGQAKQMYAIHVTVHENSQFTWEFETYKNIGQQFNLARTTWQGFYGESIEGTKECLFDCSAMELCRVAALAHGACLLQVTKPLALSRGSLTLQLFCKVQLLCAECSRMFERCMHPAPQLL